LVLGGATVSLLGFVLLALGVQQLQVGIVIAAGALLMLIAAFFGFHDVRIERDQLREKLKPVFELTDNEPACYQSGENLEQGRFDTRKVMVRNIGGTSIDSVKISLT